MKSTDFINEAEYSGIGKPNYSQSSTKLLKVLLKPGSLHPDEQWLKRHIRAELKKREGPKKIKKESAMGDAFPGLEKAAGQAQSLGKEDLSSHPMIGKTVRTNKGGVDYSGRVTKVVLHPTDGKLYAIAQYANGGPDDTFRKEIKEDAEYPIDKEYVYKIHRSLDDGKTFDHNKGDTYDNLDYAKRVKTNMLKPTSGSPWKRKIKITRHKRDKLAGPVGVLPGKKNLAELDDNLKSNNTYKQLDDYQNYAIFQLKKILGSRYLTRAQHPHVKGENEGAYGVTRQESFDNLIAMLDKKTAVRKLVTADATVDFNVKFAQNLLTDPNETFYAKIGPGPTLVIAGPDVMEYPDILRSDGFKRSSNRNYSTSEYASPLPIISLSARNAKAAGVTDNSRYAIHPNATRDKDGNRVYQLEFNSIVYASNEKVSLPFPALTVATRRGVKEAGEAAPSRNKKNPVARNLNQNKGGAHKDPSKYDRKKKHTNKPNKDDPSDIENSKNYDDWDY